MFLSRYSIFKNAFLLPIAFYKKIYIISKYWKETFNEGTIY